MSRVQRRVEIATQVQRWFCLALGLVLVLVLSFFGQDLWKLVTTKRVYWWRIEFEGALAGWETVSRFTENKRAGPFFTWRAENGLLHSSGWYRASSYRHTTWAIDGSVRSQWWLEDGMELGQSRPPWRWEAEPQLEPTAPWLELDMNARDWVLKMGGKP